MLKDFKDYSRSIHNKCRFDNVMERKGKELSLQTAENDKSKQIPGNQRRKKTYADEDIAYKRLAPRPYVVQL